MPALNLTIAGALAALLAAGTAFGADDQAEVRAAGEALARHDPASALPALDRALRQNPEDAEAFMLLGRTYVALGRHGDAATAFGRAADLRGRESEGGLDAMYAMADALAREERNEEAVAVLEQMLAVDPTRPAVHHDLGMIHLVLGRLAPAAEEFRKEIATHAGRTEAMAAPEPTLAAAHQGLGVASYRLGDDETTLASLAMAPDTVETRYTRALALARQERHEEALAEFRVVLEREPDHRGALQGLARAAGALGMGEDRAAALGRFQELYDRHERDRATRNRVTDLRKQAETKALAGDTEGAVAALNEAMALAPDDIEVGMDLGRWLMIAGDAPRSEAAFRKVLEREPLLAEAHYRLGRILAARGDTAAAIASMERAAQLSPMALSYHVYLAQNYLRVNRAADAVRELRLARRMNPSDPEGSYNLGLGLAQAGSLSEAAAELEAAITLGYKDPRVHQALSQIYRGLGDLDRSRREQERFVELSAGPADRP